MARWYVDRWWRGAFVATLVVGCADSPVSAGGEGSGASGDSSSASGDGETEADDAAGDTTDVPDIECETTLETDLPGVTIDIDAECAYALADAQAGLQTPYTIVIAQTLSSVDSGDDCWETPVGGIHVAWRIEGANGQRHCQCDVGPCGEHTPMPTDLVVSETMRQFSWAAFDWDGPSDTGVQFGAAFAPGEYTITVEATGTWVDPEGATVPFTVRATRPVRLVQ